MHSLSNPKPRGSIAMKSIPLLGLALLGAVASPVLGAGITEPPSVFFGRIYQRIGAWEFTINEGHLAWTLGSATLSNQSYRIEANLKPAAGSGLSYLLRIPHEVLAFDLTVKSNTVPLTAVGFEFLHRNITVNGQPATLVAPAVDAFTARQTSRAATYRIDLEVPTFSPDSDGDGIPDWWEDKYGTDKWDPSDGPSVLLVNPGGDARNTNDNGRMTFAQWRTQNFPLDTRDLNLFAGEDADRDGIVNLLEYAFNLNPKQDLEERANLPRGVKEEGRFVLRYARRADADDLEYAVERSSDLLTWHDAAAEVEETTQPSGSLVRVEVRTRAALTDDAHVFLRVVVHRKP